MASEYEKFSEMKCYFAIEFFLEKVSELELEFGFRNAISD
jgi:hypothetical protein